MPKKTYDPLDYIEQAFLDVRQAGQQQATEAEIDAEVDTIKPFTKDFVSGAPTVSIRHEDIRAEPKPKRQSLRLKKTQMNAPRPRRKQNGTPAPIVDDRMEHVWMLLPKNLKFLAGVYDDN